MALLEHDPRSLYELTLDPEERVWALKWFWFAFRHALTSVPHIH